MNLPTFTITHLIVDYLIKLEVALEKIKTTPLPRPHLKELQGRLEAQDIEQVSELLNDPIGFYKAEQIQKGYIMPTRKSKHLIYANYRSALEFAKNYKSTTSMKPSVELLQHVNKIVAKRVVDDWEGGKIRTFADSPNEAYDTWYKLRDYYPNLSLPEYFVDVFEWVNNNKYATHRMIRMAVLLYELIEKAPLFVGNQLTTIVLMDALSTEYGYNPHSMFSFSKALNFISDDMISAFKLAKSKRDLTVFIEAFLYTCSLEMLNLQDEVAATFDQKIKKGGKLRAKFNSRQIRALEYLENVDKITREEYAKMMRISFMTAYRDLKHLLDEQYLDTKGVGRGTFYTLSSEKKKERKEEDKKDLPVFGGK